jgi:transglutaminase-like putative cysteine protease
MIDRREFLAAGAAIAATAGFPKLASADAAFAPHPAAWRMYDVITRLQLADGSRGGIVWTPLPRFAADEWSRPGKSQWKTNAARAAIARDPIYGAEMLVAEWEPATTAPFLEVVSRVAVRDRATDFTAPSAAQISPSDRALYLRATELIPTDGIVQETSRQIVEGAADDLDKARLIYDWVVANTVRDPRTRGCGPGDIAAMLRTGQLSGKCADINALFVGLARAAGLPARDLYGLRIAPSQFGLKSLGANSEIVTKAQHCRAEVFLTGFGWTPVDPADVRKFMLEEVEGGLPADDPRVAIVRAKLFGAWEGNWLPFNSAHDLALPGSLGTKLGFLMYPQAEIASARLDCLDPDTFKYSIRSTAASI